MSRPNLDEIRERRAAATDEYWSLRGLDGRDAKFVAYSRYDVAALLGYVAELEAERDGAEQARKDAVETLDAEWVTHQEIIAMRSRAEQAEAEVARLDSQRLKDDAKTEEAMSVLQTRAVEAEARLAEQDAYFEGGEPGCVSDDDLERYCNSSVGDGGPVGNEVPGAPAEPSPLARLRELAVKQEGLHDHPIAGVPVREESWSEAMKLMRALLSPAGQAEAAAPADESKATSANPLKQNTVAGLPGDGTPTQKTK